MSSAGDHSGLQVVGKPGVRSQQDVEIKKTETNGTSRGNGSRLIRKLN